MKGTQKTKLIMLLRYIPSFESERLSLKAIICAAKDTPDRRPRMLPVSFVGSSSSMKDFELGLINPVMWFDNDDKKVIHPERFAPEELHYIAHAVNCNNSDFDMCDYQGKTVITYSWGNQYGKEFLALAEYDGTQEEFLKSFF